ncbi:MAG: phosphoenolpyruvate carboxykinase domain-containing protein, partial [Clostridia bacterium]
VLDWIIRRTEGTAEAVETPIGFEPKPEDIDITGLDITLDDMKEMLSVDKELWRQDAAGIEEFYAKFGTDLPKEMREQLDILEKNVQ